MKLQDYLMSSRDAEDYEIQIDNKFCRARRIICKDGFSLSVQANYGAYCIPRTNVAEWTHVEVGFPSAKPEFFPGYAEGLDYSDDKENFDYTETVYGYVPIGLVEQCIDFHSGMVTKEEQNA